MGTASQSVAFAAGSPAASSATTTHSTTHSTQKVTARPSTVVLAPADEYFGPLKLSFIGMRNTIRDLGLRYDVNHDIATQTLASAQLTERAVRDWERKYPTDTQIPKTIYLLQRLYTKVLTLDARAHAHACAMWLFHDYARSGQARQLQKTLAMEHLQPLSSPAPAPATLTNAGSTATAANASPAPASMMQPMTSTSDVTTIH